MNTLTELQDIAEKKGEAVFMSFKVTCLHSILLAVQEAMKGVDEIEYASPYIVKATNTLPAGIWAGPGPCGVVVAGAMALSLKYGTDDYNDVLNIWKTGMRARDWYHWFKEQFGSCDCLDLSAGTDFSSMKVIEKYYASPKVHICNVYVKRGVREIIDRLTAEDKSVER